MPMFPPPSVPAVAPGSLGLYPAASDLATPIMRLRAAGLLTDPGTRVAGWSATATPASGSEPPRREAAPKYTPKDVLEAQQHMAEYFQNRPMAPILGGTTLSGIGATAANIGNPFLGMYMYQQGQRQREENERLNAQAARGALGAKTLEDAVAALAGGDPSQRQAALSAQLPMMVEDERTRRAMERFQQLQAARQQPQVQAQPEPQQPPPPAAPLIQEGPPVAPRSVQLLPIDEAGTAAAPPGSAPPVEAPQPPVPAGPPASPLSGFGATGNYIIQNAPQAVGSFWRNNIQPPAGAVPPGNKLTPPAAAPAPAAGGPQVRGWLGDEQQPDFVGTPWARGVRPQGAPASAPQPAPIAPRPQSQTIPQPQAPQSLQLDEQTVMDMVRSRLITPQEAGIWLQSIRRNPGEIIQEQAAQQRGKALGEAQAGLPQSINAAQSTIQKIDEIAANPQLERIIGWNTLNPLGYLPYTPQQQALVERIKQVQGRFFLQAFDALRGGGQITEKEGEKAQEAISRLMNTKQDIRGYRTALEDARREVWNLTNVARVRAGLPPVSYQPAAPAVGTVRDGYRFNGGNPADPNSWQRVQ